MRDIGANLAGKQFTHDLGEVITRARESGVEFIDVTGTDLPSSVRASELARDYPDYLASTAGVHPHAAKTMGTNELTQLRLLLALPTTLMCGEMGLDFARNFSTPAEQCTAFESQLDLAEEFDKPLFLHCRDAFDEFLAIMDKRPKLWSKAIVHCFTGDISQARALAERDAYIGITGWIADKRRNADVLGAIQGYPIDRILIETDAPYLMPLNKPRSQARDRNEPAMLGWVAQALAQALSLSTDEVAKTTLENSDRLIGRPHTYEPRKIPQL